MFGSIIRFMLLVLICAGGHAARLHAACMHYEDHIHTVATLSQESPCHDVASDGTSVLLARGNYGLQIIDASDPEAGYVRSSVSTIFALSVYAQGAYAYVGGGYDGFHIIDISNADRPVLTSTIRVGHFTSDVAVRDDMAYVADPDSGLVLYDVADKGTPVRTHSPLLPLHCHDVCLKDDLLIATGLEPSLALYRLGRTDAPVLLGTLELPSQAHGVDVAGDHLLVAAYGTGLVSVDISDPSACTIDRICRDATGAYDVLVQDDRAFLSSLAGNVHVYEIESPFHLDRLGRIVTGPARCLASHSGNPVLGDDSLGLLTVLNPEADFARPRTLLQDRSVYGLAIRDASAALIGARRLTMCDVLGDGSLQEVASLDLAGSPCNALFHGNHLIVEDNDFGMQIVDVENPEAPEFVTYHQFFNDHRDMAIWRDYLYFPARLWGMQVFDISDPTNPVHLNPGQGDQDADLVCMCVEGDLAYVASDPLRLSVYDLNLDPVSLHEVGRLGTLSAPNDVMIYGDTGYLVTDEDGLIIFDCASPTDLRIVSTYPMAGRANHVLPTRNMVYVSLVDMGIHVLDVSDRENPVPVGFVLDGLSIDALTLDDPSLYAALGRDGFAILDRQCGDETVPAAPIPRPTPYALSLYPNPCNPATEASFELDTAQSVDLAVYDARGQRVTTLYSGWMEEGHHALRWMGRSDDGRAQPSGVYFVRAAGRDGAECAKFMLLK